MTKSVFFIDSRVLDYQALISSLPPDDEVVLVDSQNDGLAQIANYLQNRSGVDAIHIVSHGSEGTLYLGSSTLGTNALDSHTQILQSIGQSLTTEGDILLYGCNVAAGDTGIQFINRLGQLTGADVAASSDLTGDSVQQGNWVLESRTGSIEAAALHPVNYSHTLSANSAPTFAIGDGKVTTAVGTSSDNASGLTIQSNGQILVVGDIFNVTDNDFAVVRYNSNGSLDTSFDADGKAITPVLSGYDFGSCVVVQSDDKIVVAGSSSNSTSNYDFSLVRYNPDGSLDSTFDGDGKVTTSLGSGTDEAQAIALQGDGKILVAGSSRNAFNWDFALVRYDSTGALDSSFGTGGKVTTAIGSSDDNAQNLVLQGDGKILVAGTSTGGSNTDFALVRYSSSGTLDSSFGTSGKVTTAIGSGNDDAQGLALQGDGKILVAGYSSNGTNNDFALVRYDSTGALDSSFGTNGKVTTAIGTGEDLAFSVIIQPDGKILVAGYSSNGTNNDFALVRYDSTGALDSSFGTGGKVTTAIGSGEDYGYAMSLLSSGKILVAGTSSSDFALLRYNPDGSLDFAFDGVNTLDGTPGFTENGSAVVLDNNVQIYDSDLAVAGAYNGATLTLSRHGGASAQDIFSGSGTLSTLTEGGSLIVSGTTIGTVTTNSSGTLVLTFNASATQALVNGALQQIAYSNSSDTPPASVQIDWGFSDGNTGAQGSGGALSASGSTTVSIAAVNDAYTGGVSISGTPTQGQLLTASNTLADADGQGAISYQWKADGSNIATGTSYTLTEADVGKALTVVASYTDGGGTVESATSTATAAVVNVNDLPVGAPIIAGAATEGQVLTANTSSISDADGLGAISYQWKAAGINIAGATGNTYTLTSAEIGKPITIVASYVDGHGTPESIASIATPAVASSTNHIPAGIPAITGAATQGQTLTADGSSISDIDGLGTFSYMWSANGVTIGGANASTYTLTEAEVGKVITVTLTYTDVLGSAEAVSSAATLAVANINDSPTGSVSISGTANQGQLLTATHTLADADGLGTVNYQWKAGDSNIAGATAASYTLTPAEMGKTITVVATYTDGHGTPESVSSGATAAVISVDTDTATINEDVAAVTGNVLTNDTGSGKAVTAFKNSDNIAGVVGDGLAGRYGSLTLNADGSYSYALDNELAAIQALRAGATFTDSFGYSMQDAAGTSGSSTLTVTITGINDVPEVKHIPDQATTSALGFNYTIPDGTFSDVDTGDTLTYSAVLVDDAGALVDTGLLPTGLTFDASTRAFSGTSIAAGRHNIKVSASDGTDSTSTTFILAVKNAVTIDKGKFTGGDNPDFIAGSDGAGADKMVGGGGDDTYVVDNMGDKITELVDGGIDEVESKISYKLGKNLENLSLTGTDNIDGTGNDGANILTGNDGDNELDGGTGVDTFIGGKGNDTYLLDDLTEAVTEFEGEGDSDAIKLKVNNLAQDADNNYQMDDYVENLEITGAAEINVAGNAEGNNIKGNAKANTLDGLAGDDTLDGGKGADTLEGGVGNDTYYVDTGDKFNAAGELTVTGDTVIENEGSGTDIVYSSAASYILADNVETLALIKTGGKGTGNADNNTITGNDKANTLDGAEGNDTIDGGKGKDILLGDTGADIFVFSTALGKSNVDSLQDFETGVDKIQLDADIFTMLANDTDLSDNFLGDNKLSELKKMQDADDYLLFDNTTGALYYDADGSGTESKAIQFATLKGPAPDKSILDVHATDILIG